MIQTHVCKHIKQTKIMSREYIDNLFLEFPKIPELYSSDKKAEFPGADGGFVSAVLGHERMKNKLRYVRFFHEAYDKEVGSIARYEDAAEAYSNYGFSGILADQQLVACRLNDKVSLTDGINEVSLTEGIIRDVAIVELKDIPYLEGKVREHNITRSAEILGKEITEFPESWTPDMRRKTIKRIATIIVDYSNEWEANPMALTDKFKHRGIEETYQYLRSWLGMRTEYLKPQGDTVEEFARSEYNKLSEDKKAQEIYSIYNILEPDMERHSPWAKTFAKKIVIFGEKEELSPSKIAEAIAAEDPNQTLDNFWRLIDEWRRAKAMGMPTETFESNGFSLDEGYEYDKGWQR